MDGPQRWLNIKKKIGVINSPTHLTLKNSTRYLLSILTLCVIYPGQTLYWIQIFTIGQLHTYQFCFPLDCLHYTSSCMVVKNESKAWNYTCLLGFCFFTELSAYFKIYFEDFSYTGVHIKDIVLIKVFKTIVIPRVKFVFDKRSGIWAFAATNPIYLLRPAGRPGQFFYGNCYSTVHRVTNRQKELKNSCFSFNRSSWFFFPLKSPHATFHLKRWHWL